MSMYENAEILKKEFEDSFKDGMTFKQLWFITKIAKGARLYCRSNSAFNNYMNHIFGNIAKFDQVEKVRIDGKKYMGLKITMKKEGVEEIKDYGDEEW